MSVLTSPPPISAQLNLGEKPPGLSPLGLTSTQNGDEEARSPGRLLWLLSRQHWGPQADLLRGHHLLGCSKSFPPPSHSSLHQLSSYPEKEEKKKGKDLKMTKKLERQRAQEEQAKRQQEEEAAAQSEDRGERAGSWAGQRRAEGPLGATGPRHLVLMEKLRLGKWEGPKKLSPNLLLRWISVLWKVSVIYHNF